MGPTKAVAISGALYEAKTARLIKDGLAAREEQEEYAKHHCLLLPVLDNEGRPWSIDGKHVYCLDGTRYETSDDEVVHLAKCRDCGGMCISFVEPDCGTRMYSLYPVWA
ncbi:MAG: hypothetical protein ACHQYP_09300 [Nitrospiria bacterium]